MYFFEKTKNTYLQGVVELLGGIIGGGVMGYIVYIGKGVGGGGKVDFAQDFFQGDDEKDAIKRRFVQTVTCSIFFIFDESFYNVF